MPGVEKIHRRREYGRAFPASRYNDPRGGRPSALEINVLRYRAIEAALYLFYTEEIRAFMLDNVLPQALRKGDHVAWVTSNERGLEVRITELINKAELAEGLSADDAAQMRSLCSADRKQSKQLRIAFSYAVKMDMFSQSEMDELKELLDYRNDIAHRIHLVMSDISRCTWTTEHFSYVPPVYKGRALDRLRSYRKSLWERADHRFILMLSMDGFMFEFAEQAYERELKRLDRQITAQIDRERRRAEMLRSELDLSGTELTGDLDPRFPTNHRYGRTYGDDYVPPSGHLTPRGVEICYRLYDLGKSPLAVAYLMGMTLKSAQHRQRTWERAGGANRLRAEVERYEFRSQRDGT